MDPASSRRCLKKGLLRPIRNLKTLVSLCHRYGQGLVQVMALQCSQSLNTAMKLLRLNRAIRQVALPAALVADTAPIRKARPLQLNRLTRTRRMDALLAV